MIDQDTIDALLIAVLSDPERGPEIAQWAADNPKELEGMAADEGEESGEST